MPANTYEDEIFREKRIPKNPIKFKISLNEEQKAAKELILQNTITLLAGKAGSGKTLLACQVALDGLFRKQYEKIIITRPTVSKEEIGFLPGDLHQKMDPWVQPIYQNMYILYGKDKIEPYIQGGQIEIVPLSFMRGRTFVNACLIEGESILTETGYIKVEDILSDAILGKFHNVLSYNESTETFEYKLLDAISPAQVDYYIEIELENGVITKVSGEHEFYTARGLVKAKDLTEDDEILSL
jgi:energy-coupling factor transporter ATP-binding protein EcfA2